MFRNSLSSNAMRPLALAFALSPLVIACADSRASAETAVSTEASVAAQEPPERCPVRPVAGLGADAAAAAVAAPDSARIDSASTLAGTDSVAGTDSSAAPPAPRMTRADSARAALRARWASLDTLPRLPGSILPGCRIIAYYGNPLSKRMGALGEFPKDEMLARLDRQVAEWAKVDSTVKTQPALHLIAVVAQGSPGRDNKWRMRMPDTLIEKVASWAQEKDALLFLDVQVGLSTIQEELPRLLPWLERPNVHLGIDPEFSMKDGTPPGKKIGTYTAEDINYVIRTLADVVEQKQLPPKVLVIHRFTRNMVRNSDRIRIDPRVQVVMHMDGWGGKTLKIDSYKHYVVAEPVQFTGFKIFYFNDQRKPGTKVMTPQEVMESLEPKPLYIQYQ